MISLLFPSPASPALRLGALPQELKDQLAEEEMRDRDFHQALLALDEQMAKGKPFLDLSPEEQRARLSRADRAEVVFLGGLTRQGWGPAQMYQRLSPAQRLALANGETLTFRSH